MRSVDDWSLAVVNAERLLQHSQDDLEKAFLILIDAAPVSQARRFARVRKALTRSREALDWLAADPMRSTQPHD